MTGYASFALLGILLPIAPGALAPARGDVRLTPVQTLYDGTGLREAIAVVSSPDGRHVYAAGHADSALVAFARDPVTGALTRVQVSRDDVGGVDGLRRVSSLAVSADGKHLYAVGAGEDALGVFARDPLTGLLQLVEVVHDPRTNGLDSFTGSIAVAPEGGHVYVTGFDSVSVFSRNALSGRLSFVETETISDGPVRLEGTDAIAVSPDGRHVYVDRFDDALVIFTRDPEHGTLARSGVLRDGVDGVDGLALISGISTSADGRNVYVAAYNDDSIAVFDRNPDSGELTFGQIFRDGGGAVRGLEGAVSVAVSGNGRRVYAAGLESSSLVVFERDTVDGRLELVEVFVDGEGATDGLRGAIQVTVSSDNANVYVAALFDDAIAVFADGPVPRFVTAERNIEGSIHGLAGARAAVLSPDEEHLYVAGYVSRVGADSAAITVFTRDAASGRLEFVEAYVGEENDRLRQPVSLAVTADGGHLLVADFLLGGVFVLRRDPATGRLSLVQHIDHRLQTTDPDAASAVYIATAIAGSPEGAQAFVTSFVRNTLAVFDREAASGELRFRMALGDDIDRNDPTAIAVSDDGLFVYTTGSFGGAVVAFRRNAASGGLELAQDVREGQDGVVGLRGASALALSPDESALYIVSGGLFHGDGDGADALAIFERDRENGRLSFVQALADGVGGVDGLAGASSVAILPDGSTLFVTGPNDNALAVFARDRVSGHVTFERAVRDGEGGADGLGGATSVIASQDSRYLYLTGSADNSVTVFRVTAIDEASCPGDCAADASVSIGELVLCVNIALGRRNLAECFMCDPDASGTVNVGDLIRAVASSLNGCPNGRLTR